LRVIFQQAGEWAGTRRDGFGTGSASRAFRFRRPWQEGVAKSRTLARRRSTDMIEVGQGLRVHEGATLVRARAVPFNRSGGTLTLASAEREPTGPWIDLAAQAASEDSGVRPAE